MGKKNSKLKQETVDQLISQTYCEFIKMNIMSFLHYMYFVFP